MDDLIAFLRERLDYDERVAADAAELLPDDDWWEHQSFVAYGYPNSTPNQISHHIGWNDPAHVLADVAAKRKILDRAERVLESFNDPAAGPWPDVSRRERSHAVETIHDLALPHAGHSSFREEWRT